MAILSGAWFSAPIQYKALRVKAKPPQPMNQVRVYEPRRFKSAAPFYERYRLGYPDRLIRRVIALAGLSPGDPVSYRFNTGAGIACLLMGRYDDAVAFCEKARRSHGKWGPTFRILAAGYAHLGQTQKASEALVRYRELEPSASIAHLHRQLPYRNVEQAERLWEGLRKAGLQD